MPSDPSESMGSGIKTLIESNMDNRIFSVNGKGKECLLETLKLVFNQCSDYKDYAVGWKISKQSGLILCWYVSEGYNINPFPAKMTAEDCLPFIWNWLQTPEAGKTARIGFDAARDHDGDNGSGWRVFCEDWGHVDHIHSAICAIKPVVLWYGK